MIVYPHINPIAVSIGPVLGIGPLRIHWYGIMYLIGFMAGWALARHRALQPKSTWTPLDVDDLIFYCAIGVILGGRAGWCIFYGHDVIAEHWTNAFHVWDGGMSFHGGMLGVAVAIIVFCRRNGIPLLGFADRIAVCAPIGLGLGRIANFINGELWGRITDVSWAIIYPGGAVSPSEDR